MLFDTRGGAPPMTIIDDNDTTPFHAADRQCPGGADPVVTTIAPA
jgi:hypothetical protein